MGPRQVALVLLMPCIRSEKSSAVSVASGGCHCFPDSWQAEERPLRILGPSTSMAWSGATRDARPDPTVPGGTLGLKSRYGDNGQDSLDPPATQIGSHAEVVDSDYAVSDDGEADGSTAIREDDAEMLGVSISSEQVRMKSAQTPAMEKAIAMESLEDDVEGFVADQLTDLSGAGEEGQRLQMTESRVNQTAQVEAGAAEHTEESMPSPWQAPSTTFLRSDATKSFLRDSFSTSRRRSSSGASTVADSLKRLLPSLSGLNLPKAPNLSSFTFSNWPKDEKSDYDESRRKRSTTLFSSFRTSSPEMADRLERLNLSNGTGHDVTSPGLEQKTQQRPGKQLLVGPDRTTADIKSARSESRPHTIRRATSDSSLFLRRTRSPASTLDDTQRWDNIQDQVNSRFKAIKDSFQDTNIRMPKFPSVNLAALRPDFQYTRAHSDSARSGLTLHDPVTGAYKPTMHLSSGENGLRKEEPQIARVNHPVLNKALAHLVGDVVVLGGYRGSVLRSAKPPYRQLWVPVKVGLNLRKVDLEVGLEPGHEERMHELIIASGTLSHIGPIDICRRLIRKLRKCRNAQEGYLRVWDYGASSPFPSKHASVKPRHPICLNFETTYKASSLPLRL